MKAIEKCPNCGYEMENIMDADVCLICPKCGCCFDDEDIKKAEFKKKGFELKNACELLMLSIQSRGWYEYY